MIQTERPTGVIETTPHAKATEPQRGTSSIATHTAAPESHTADVLVVGCPSVALVALAHALRGRGFTCRATLATGELFGLSAEHLPHLLILADAAELDAIELTRRLAAHRRMCDVPVMVVSECARTARKLEAFSAGAVDYVCTSVDAGELLARVLAHVRLRRAQLEAEQHSLRLEAFVLEQVSELTSSQMATIIALAKLAESRDDQTGGHLERVQQYCRLLAAKLSEEARFGVIDHSYIDNIEYASALHDIGKVAISDLILLKPGELTLQEFEFMKTHTTLGAQTLEAVSEEYPNNDFIAMGIMIARWHHERWDGTGYPDGLSGEAIPLSARIMAVADVYDALMSQRSYKDSFTHADSREIIVKQSGLQFDPAVVGAFLTLDAVFAKISAG